MAITNSDGSIILSTKVDTSGVKKATNDLRSEAMKLAAQYRKAGMTQSEAQKKAYRELGITTKETEKATKTTKKYGEQVKSTKNAVLPALGKIASALAAAFSINVLINFGKEAINLASDLQEVQNVVDTAFGDMSYKIEDFSKNAIETFGLSELAAKQWASTMMAMGTGMGQALEVGSDMAVELTGRLADVMSFYNKTEEEAFTLGKAIYSGETEPLKAIGIIMTEVNLELFAMQKGYKQAYKEMDAANKLLVRQQFFLEKTALAAGDYTKTADGWANQTRTLTQRWKEMQAAFGETFIALGVLVLPLVEDVIEGLNQIAAMLKVISANFGLIKTAESANSQISSDSEQTAENIENQTENQKELNKELKKSLAGFDDIQILSSQTAASVDDAGENPFDVTDIGGVSAGAGTQASVDNLHTEEISTELIEFTAIIAGALVAVGLILLFNGQIGWGLGFIIGGAGAFGVANAYVQTMDVTNETRKTFEAITLIVSALMWVVGVILVCSGVGLPIGLGLIAAAWAGAGSVVAPRWDTIVFAVERVWNSIISLVQKAVVPIGILLIITGINVGLGLGLLGYSTATGFADFSLFEGIFEAIKSVWQKIKDFWDKNIHRIFTFGFWRDLGATAVNGLISAFESGLNTIIFELNNFIYNINAITAAFGWDALHIDSISSISLPRIPVAEGSVIPTNPAFTSGGGGALTGKTPIQQTTKEVEERYYLNETEVMSLFYRLAEGGRRLQGEGVLK